MPYFFIEKQNENFTQNTWVMRVILIERRAVAALSSLTHTRDVQKLFFFLSCAN
jgi:hypothetical protein